MSTNDIYTTPANDMNRLRSLNDKLNSKVIEQINSTQELVMLNDFAHESNEYLLRRSLEERISEIASWRWVLIDLSKRLKEAIATLHHEHKTLGVVLQRIQDEIDGYSYDANRPEALTPFTNSVEDAMKHEHIFLRNQKKQFEAILIDLDKQIDAITDTDKRIEADINNKAEGLSIDKTCINGDQDTSKFGRAKKKKKRAPPLARWEKKCENLKRDGVRALGNAITIRQQVRGARVHLSIVAQACAARVDSALRRRLHSNRIKLQDLNWQKDEAVRDYKALEEELNTTEKTILETMEQERIVEARLANRNLRPQGEYTRDSVDRKLRDELGRLKCFCKHLRINSETIRTLQNSLTGGISRVSCYVEDIIQVVCLDEDRIRFRLGEELNSSPPPSTVIIEESSSSRQATSVASHSMKDEGQLTSIKEEDEDDYPLDY